MLAMQESCDGFNDAIVRETLRRVRAKLRLPTDELERRWCDALAVSTCATSTTSKAESVEPWQVFATSTSKTLLEGRGARFGVLADGRRGRHSSPDVVNENSSSSEEELDLEDEDLEDCAAGFKAMLQDQQQRTIKRAALQSGDVELDAEWLQSESHGNDHALLSSYHLVCSGQGSISKREKTEWTVRLESGFLLVSPPTAGESVRRGPTLVSGSASEVRDKGCRGEGENYKQNSFGRELLLPKGGELKLRF